MLRKCVNKLLITTLNEKLGKKPWKSPFVLNFPDHRSGKRDYFRITSTMRPALMYAIVFVTTHMVRSVNHEPFNVCCAKKTKDLAFNSHQA